LSDIKRHCRKLLIQL